MKLAWCRRGFQLLGRSLRRFTMRGSSGCQFRDPIFDPKHITSFAATLMLLFAAGAGVCNGLLGGSKNADFEQQKSWHEIMGWKAENYFDDALTVQLCRAIEANDLKEVDRLISAGVDVNVRGKENMTLLLWAFPDGKIERFKKILLAGGDPNVVIESDFGFFVGQESLLPRELGKGDSITLLSARSEFQEHFRLVMENGGNPNLLHGEYGTSPLITILREPSILEKDRASRVRLLIDHMADLDLVCPTGRTPAMWACLVGRFDLALELLVSGASPRAYNEKSCMKVSHLLVVLDERKSMDLTDLFREDFDRLVSWLNDHGESFEEARRDLQVHRQAMKEGRNYLCEKRKEQLKRQKAGQDGEPRANP